MAHTSAIRRRILQRVPSATIGMSPSQFIQEICLDQATFLLRTTTRTPDAIAIGYRNVSTLRTLIRRRRGTTLAAVRQNRAIS